MDLSEPAVGKVEFLVPGMPEEILAEESERFTRRPDGLYRMSGEEWECLGEVTMTLTSLVTECLESYPDDMWEQLEIDVENRRFDGILLVYQLLRGAGDLGERLRRLTKRSENLDVFVGDIAVVACYRADLRRHIRAGYIEGEGFDADGRFDPVGLVGKQAEPLRDHLVLAVKLFRGESVEIHEDSLRLLREIRDFLQSGLEGQEGQRPA
jgi:hypothetical protein